MTISGLRSARFLGTCAVVAVAVPTALAVTMPSSQAATVSVAADGTGTYRTIQAAISAVPSGTTITVKPGRYAGQVSIPSSKPGLSIVGSTGNPADVVITGNTPQSAVGAARSATVLNLARNTTFRAVTIANTYGSGSQALALYLGGDRQVYDTVRLLGRQDTLLTWTGGNGPMRQYIYNSYVEGDVDFVYGDGTLVIDRSTIASLTRNSSNNGFITAAATSRSAGYGILITGSTLTSSAAAGTVALGRCWHPGDLPNASGQVLVRDSTLGAHLRQSGAWQDMGGYSWRTCRFAEYNNSGPGRSNGTSDRPQLSASNAANYTARRYLAGSDGWNPVR